MSFVFYYPQKSGATTTVTLPNPERGNPERSLLVQASGRTMAGTLRVYNKGTARKEIDIHLEDLTNTQKGDLLSFFQTKAVGMQNAFQVDDHHGSLLNARFLQSEMEFSEDYAETVPVTNPLWSVEIKLEVWS